MTYLPSIPFPNGAAEVRVPKPPDPTDCAKLQQASDRAELAGIVQRARAGDLAAQSEIVRRYTKRIAGFVKRFVYQPSAIDDVVQLVFIKMVRRINLVRDPMTFESWLFVLARNTALDQIRRERCRPVTVPGERHFFEAPETSDPAALPEIMEALEVALHRLSPKDRNLVRLVVDGHSYRMIAVRERLSINAVKVRLNRVRPYLRASVSRAIGLERSDVVEFRLPSRGRTAA